MAKTEAKKHYDALRRDTDNYFYTNLMSILNLEGQEILELMVRTVDKDELIRLQGKAQILKHIVTELSRKPIDGVNHATGAFN